jgi:hypothetical protein
MTSPWCSDFIEFSVGFCTGIIFGPWNSGILWLIIFLILAEIIYAYRKWDSWSWTSRIIIVLGYILGWVLGCLIEDLNYKFCFNRLSSQVSN